jgi:hypothetical protein
MRYNKLSALPKPPTLEVSNIRRILKSARSTKYLLKDIDVEAWNAQADEDLVALSSSDLDLDPFASWARSSFLIHLHKMIGFRWVVRFSSQPFHSGSYVPRRHTLKLDHNQKLNPITGLASYSDKMTRNVTNVFRSLLITAIPAASITVLYVVESIALKIVFIVMFAGIFTVLISLFTNAKTVELFMLTAA